MDVSKNVEIKIDNCRDLTMPKRPSRWKHIIRTHSKDTNSCRRGPLNLFANWTITRHDPREANCAPSKQA
jgi:hypothetical protein